MEGCGSTNQHAKKKQCNRPVAERYCLKQVTFKLKFKRNLPLSKPSKNYLNLGRSRELKAHGWEREDEDMD